MVIDFLHKYNYNESMTETVAAPSPQADIEPEKPAEVPPTQPNTEQPAGKAPTEPKTTENTPDPDFSNEPVQGSLTAEQKAELDALKHGRQKTEIEAVGEALLKQHTGEVNRLVANEKTTPEQRAALESAQSTKALQLIDWVRKTQAVQDGGVSLQGNAPILYIGGKEYRPKKIVSLEGDEYECLDHNGQKMPVVHRNQLMNALLVSERTTIVNALPAEQQGAMNAYIDMQIAQAKGEEYKPSDTASADIESAAKSAGFITAEIGRNFAKKNIADDTKLQEALDFLEDKSMRKFIGIRIIFIVTELLSVVELLSIEPE